MIEAQALLFEERRLSPGVFKVADWMKVAHFSTFAEGGAATLMLRLHEALLSGGVDSRVYYRRGHLFARHGQRMEYAGNHLSHIRERIKWRVENLILKQPGNLFSTLRSPFKSKLATPDQAADIFHLHWISHWLDLPCFVESLPPQAPLVITLHDFGNFTGGCHLFSDCMEFQEECRLCPLLKTPFDRFVAHREWRRKKRCFGSRPLYVVGNSRWTTSMAASASVFAGARSVETIHPGIDPDAFVCFDKSYAKEALGIPAHRFVAGFGCAELTDGNKNFPAFLELLRQLAGKIELEAVVFGSGLSLTSEPPAKIHSLGKLASSRLLSLAYSAMDVFVMTSSIETFGQVALEAQACGTPVCAFDVGGLSDVVKDGETGFLGPPGDIAALSANVLTVAHDQQKRTCLGQAGRASARRLFSQERAVGDYLRLYRNALEQESPCSTPDKN